MNHRSELSSEGINWTSLRYFVKTTKMVDKKGALDHPLVYKYTYKKTSILFSLESYQARLLKKTTKSQRCYGPFFLRPPSLSPKKLTTTTPTTTQVSKKFLKFFQKFSKFPKKILRRLRYRSTFSRDKCPPFYNDGGTGYDASSTNGSARNFKWFCCNDTSSCRGGTRGRPWWLRTVIKYRLCTVQLLVKKLYSNNGQWLVLFNLLNFKNL